MVTKEELSDRLNDLLGVEDSIDFAKMTKEDLDRLIKVVAEPSNLIRIGWKNLRNKAKKEILEELIGRPFLDEVLKGIPSKEEGKGPLGFGILPSVRKNIQEILSPSKETKE